ncbi:hypothetical protein ACFPVX_18335 [Cohnella faecalis]|uniref:DUF4309 domain-containing protein n=1 Tax=Cohnella faecalis TaxID=2315694 RepID=A0A398CK45_9BACL|nr:hypothetical protein [Cohnella faecalis]RIE01238.1 hypothetical protein D3H35_22865 [Cohnella faecalis]
MRKMLILLITAISLTGCFGGSGEEVQTAEPTATSIDQSADSNVEDPEPSATNFDILKQIMGLNKQQVIEKLGKSYTKYVGSDSQPGQGIAYEQLGLRIVFDEKMGRIETIYCNELIDIEGVKLGMEPSYFIDMLGGGAEKMTTGRKPSYEVSFNFGPFFVWIQAANKESPTTQLVIRRNHNYDESIASHAAFKSDLKHIQAIFNMDREPVIETLGMDYSLYYGNDGDTHLGIGINFEKYGLTLLFDDSGDRVDGIYCDEGAAYEGVTKVDINGAKLGMTFAEIRKLLGEGEFIDRTTFSEGYPPVYSLNYDFGNVTASFGVSDREGRTDELHIYRISENNRSNPKVNLIKPIANELDFSKIKELLSLTAEQVVEKLGDKRREYNKHWGQFELGNGLFYEQYGLIFAIDSDSQYTIYSRENVEINGARLGMTFSEIQQYLGTEGVVDWVEAYQPYYRLTYTYDDFTISFASYDEDGKTVEVKIQPREPEEREANSKKTEAGLRSNA